MLPNPSICDNRKNYCAFVLKDTCRIYLIHVATFYNSPYRISVLNNKLILRRKMIKVEQLILCFAGQCPRIWVTQFKQYIGLYSPYISMQISLQHKTAVFTIFILRLLSLNIIIPVYCLKVACSIRKVGTIHKAINMLLYKDHGMTSHGDEG